MAKALISVTNKTGVVALAQGLVAKGFEILSTGGTARTLKEAGVPVTEVAEYTGFPEMMDGRLKTLHTKVHGGILGVRSDPAHMASMVSHGISPIDIVVVNLYRFEETVSRKDVTLDEAIEQIDIGGPAMIRSASKNHKYVVVVVDPNDYAAVLSELEAEGSVSEVTRKRLAAKAFHHTACYDLAIARFVSEGEYDGFVGKRVLTCKGENGWQSPAALFSTGTEDPLALDKFQLVSGNEASWNNLGDLDRALQTMTHIAAGMHKTGMFFPQIALGVKHGNPCGAACGGSKDRNVDTLRLALKGDPLAIFGGLVMVNFPISVTVASSIVDMMQEGTVLDGIVAPSFAPEAIDLLSRKSGRCRFLVNPSLQTATIVGPGSLDVSPRFRQVRGGFMVQPNYTFVMDLHAEGVQRFGKISQQDEIDLVLAWAVGSTSNSNTITIVRDQQLLGNGIGQQDRVGAAELAVSRVRRSRHPGGCVAAVAYSDSFFPFPDAPAVLIDAGVNVILTTSGSKRDQETIDLCERRSVGLIMVPDAMARGFCH